MNNIIEASSALSANTYRGGFLGCLRQTSYANATDFVTFLYADTVTNPPVYILTRPRNNSVDIHTSSTTTNTNFTPIGAYVLTLSFELQ